VVLSAIIDEKHLYKKKVIDVDDGYIFTLVCVPLHFIRF
jgi:hypothetical protein